MKNIKLLSRLIISLLLLICITLMASYIFWRSYMLTEIKTLVGVFAAEEYTSATDGFRQYIEASPHDKTQFINRGTQILSVAGYSYSADRLIAKSIGSSYFFIGATFLLLSLFLVFFILLILRKIKNSTNNLEASLRTSESHVMTLQSQYAKKLEQIRQYEENLYHQIKTPLTSLRLCMDQIQTETQDPNKEVFTTAQMQLRKLSRIATLFLRDRKISTNVVKFNFNIWALDELLQDAMAQLSEYAAFKGVLLNVQIANGEYFLHCDQTWLQEAFVTIIENAIDHSASGGAVGIYLSSEPRRYRIQICTTGTELSQQQAEQIFERYYTNRSSHFGIGLHMAKTVIETHHGQITAYNQSSELLCVCFDTYLPKLSSSQIYNVT